MKLYYFAQESYGEFYIVMSDSPENALESVKKMLKNKRGNKFETKLDEEKGWVSIWWQDWEKWDKSTIEHLPAEFHLEVFEKDQVFEGEFA